MEAVKEGIGQKGIGQKGIGQKGIGQKGIGQTMLRDGLSRQTAEDGSGPMVKFR
ncbi:MAG: hypothetical protein L6Q55_07970 [Azonexus sp.]|nr:hypothetical protein [Azonexus sp.]MCK6412345.1 hypothetical protein [Azonexus sp.]